MSQVSLNNISFHYSQPYREVFSGLSLNIPGDWKTALIGNNGRGKTTLLKLFLKEISPTAGSVSVPAGLKYFPYSPANPGDNTGDVIKEAIAPFKMWEEKMNRLLEKGDAESLDEYSEWFELFNYNDGYAINSLIEKGAVEVGLSPDTLTRPFNTLSGGEKTRALILPLFISKNSFPLIDEPTDHLDMKGRELLSRFLAASPKGFILASHDRRLLDSCTDHVVSINKNDIDVLQGNYSVWKQQHDLTAEFEQRSYENLQREIKSLEKAAKQYRNWSGKTEKEKNSSADSGFVSHKAAKMMKRASSIERRMKENIQSKKDLLKNHETAGKVILKNTGKTPGSYINASGISVYIDDKKIINNFYLTVSRGDRVAVTGVNGSGKTTLLNVLSDEKNINEGTMFIAPNIKISRAYQVPLWQKGYLKEYLESSNLDETQFRFVMSAFGMKGEIFNSPLETYSKGQLRKIDLCRTITSSPNLLLWDEPLNYLDIVSREQVEEFITGENLTIVFVEHDITFIENTAAEVITLDKIL